MNAQQHTEAFGYAVQRRGMASRTILSKGRGTGAHYSLLLQEELSHYLLLTTHYSPPTTLNSPLTTHYPLPTPHSSLITTHY